MAHDERDQRREPRHGEERDRWREGGYRGGGAFAPESDDRYGERYGGEERSRYGGPASPDRPTGDDQDGREDYARQGDARRGPAPGAERQGRYTGFSQQGGDYERVPGGQQAWTRDHGAGSGQQDDFGRSRLPPVSDSRDLGFGPGRGFEDRRQELGQRQAFGHYSRDWNPGALAGQGYNNYPSERAAEEAQPGRHRGRGPRNYIRSDDRIREDVCERLSEDTYLDASEIEVAVQDGEVTLNGTITERGDKRRAEDLAEAVSGVRHVQNNLRVGAQPAGGGQALRDSVSGGRGPE